MLPRKKCGKRLSSAAGGGAQRLFDSQIELFHIKKTTFIKPTLQVFSRLIRVKFATKTTQILAIQLAASAQRLV